jgi:nucleotide-binding universal stress UspA family protein
MFSPLLVPLDGSHQAEAVLPLAAALARRLGASVSLLHVIERDAPPAVHGEPHLTTSDAAEAYLAALAARFFDYADSVQRHVHTTAEANVARSIVAHAEEWRSELIVLCTHGRGHLRHRLFGTVAQRVLDLGTMPVLLLHPHAAAPGTFECRRFLVPLDAQPEHAAALPIAAELARECGAALQLLAVVPTLETLSGTEARKGYLLPSTTAALLDLEEEDLDSYVRRLGAEVAATGIEVSVDLSRGDPGTAIVEAATRHHVDLIVMATHTKGGLDAFWAGSVAPKVAKRAWTPMLLVPLARG